MSFWPTNLGHVDKVTSCTFDKIRLVLAVSNFSSTYTGILSSFVCLNVGHTVLGFLCTSFCRNKRTASSVLKLCIVLTKDRVTVSVY